MEVQAQALPAYEGSNEEKQQDKIVEGSAALGGIERVEEYGYVSRGYVFLTRDIITASCCCCCCCCSRLYSHFTNTS